MRTARGETARDKGAGTYQLDQGLHLSIRSLVLL